MSGFRFRKQSVEKYMGFVMREVRKKVEEKRIWLRDNESKYYERAIVEDRDLFELFISEGYVDLKVLKKFNRSNT